MTAEIVFVRHGETESNVLGLLHGRTDVPLNQHGRSQARRVAARLATMADVAALHSSPLLRARATADEIGSRLNLVPTSQSDLAEIDFGNVEGLALAEFAERHPELYRRLQQPVDRDATFPGGESILGFHARVRRSIERLAALHSGQRIVVVAHGGVIASAIGQLIGDGPADWTRYMVRNCSMTHLLWVDDRPTLQCWDDVSHLDLLVGHPR